MLGETASIRTPYSTASIALHRVNAITPLRPRSATAYRTPWSGLRHNQIPRSTRRRPPRLPASSIFAIYEFGQRSRENPLYALPQS
jgi:hypothetical protein